MGEGSSSNAQRADAGEESHGHHVLHRHISDAHATALLDTLQEVLDKSVHSLTQTLEHDKSQRDSQDGIKHAKGLPCISSWRRMPITWEKGRRIAKINHEEKICQSTGCLWGVTTWPHYSKSPRSAFVYKHDQARNLPKSVWALPKGLLNRGMPQKCVCSLILFGLKDYGKRGVQLVRSFRWGREVWRRDWNGVM